jgi:hypothetical protein
MAFMRHNNNGRRHNNNYNNNRPRNHNPNQQGQQGNGQRRHVNRVNQVFESNGPEGRVRGTAAQIVEKYMGMARDAQVSGDRVLSMNYFQHAEHYQRLLNEITEENTAFERERDAQRAQQNTQPEISAGDAEAGFVETPFDGEQPPQQPREQRPHQDGGDRPERPDRQERSERPERNERRFDNRPPRPQRPPQQRQEHQDDDSDLNTLPSFLQVPITNAAPIASSAAAPVEKAEAIVETVAKPRTPRARRVATPDETQE